MATYIGEEKVNGGTLQYGATDPTTGTREELYTPDKISTEVPSITTDSAISQVNKQKGYMDNTYPDLPKPPDTKEQPKTQGTTYYVNEAGQEAQYTEDQLKDPKIQQFIKDNKFIPAKLDGTTGELSGIQSELDTARNAVDQMNRDFLSYNVDQDPDFKEQSKIIQAQFQKLREQMQKTNYTRAQAFQTLGYRTGAQQYAGGIQMGIEGEELNQANQRMADIAREEASAISAARTAFRTNKWAEFDKKVNALKDIRDQKQQELENYTTAITNFTKKLQEEEQMNLQNQKLKQEILTNNLDLYSSALIGYDEAGNLLPPDEDQINAYAEQLGVPPALIKSRMQAQISELSKLNQEEYKRELDIMNAQRQLIPAAFQEYEYARNNLGYGGDFFDYLAQKEQVETSMPSSYKEWQLAGQPGEFVDWLKSSSTAQPKQFQYNAANYATRAESSNQIISGLEDQFTGAKSYIGKYLPNILKSSERQQLEQAQRNFVNAVLRRESGAVISDSEFNNAAKQYFPQPGDTSDTLAQKKANREMVVRNFINEAGPAIADTSPELLNKYMQQATTYTDVFDFGKRATQQELNEFNQIKDMFPNKSPEEVFDFYQNEDFNQPLSMGVKGSDVSKIKDGTRVTTTLGSGIATGIQQGSSKWKWGYDFVLAGGKGAPIKSPFSGTVTFAGSNKGFGNQVKIKLADGREVWLSHLDAINVKPGQKITIGTLLGKQGNTGALLSGAGKELTKEQRLAGRGTHIDITIKKPDGTYFTSQQVAALLNTNPA